MAVRLHALTGDIQCKVYSIKTNLVLIFIYLNHSLCYFQLNLFLNIKKEKYVNFELAFDEFLYLRRGNHYPVVLLCLIHQPGSVESSNLHHSSLKMTNR